LSQTPIFIIQRRPGAHHLVRDNPMSYLSWRWEHLFNMRPRPNIPLEDGPFPSSELLPWSAVLCVVGSMATRALLDWAMKSALWHDGSLFASSYQAMWRLSALKGSGRTGPGPQCALRRQFSDMPVSSCLLEMFPRPDVCCRELRLYCNERTLHTVWIIFATGCGVFCGEGQDLGQHSWFSSWDFSTVFGAQTAWRRPRPVRPEPSMRLNSALLFILDGGVQ